jgi:acetoin utilization deacetylase AcuC-like enzyme
LRPHHDEGRATLCRLRGDGTIHKGPLTTPNTVTIVARTTMLTSRSSSLHLVFDPLFLQHKSRGYHPERPERLAAARRGVDKIEAEGARLLLLHPRDAGDAELLRVHASRYLDELGRLRGHYAALDADTYLAPISMDAAFRAAGGAIALVEALLAAGEGEARQGVALLRPPGHHATRDQGMGFCLLNNVAIAAAAAIHAGLGRVAIVDWDVHHGNGTQDIFWSDGRVLFISLHESPLYPGTGAAREVGEGAGLGRTINLPLPAAAHDATYRLAFEELVLPALRRFQPELVLVSAGFDAHARDPLASMQLTEVGYGWMARALRAVADESAGGRLGVVLEGGYDLTALEESLAASLRGVLGWPVPAPEGEVSARHAEAIAAAKRANESARAEAERSTRDSLGER